MFRFKNNLNFSDIKIFLWINDYIESLDFLLKAKTFKRSNCFMIIHCCFLCSWNVKRPCQLMLK